MKILRLSIYLVTFFAAFNLIAQSSPTQPTPAEPCNHRHQTQKLYEEFPHLKPSSTTDALIKKACDLNRTIPVVVHIVHMCGPENISDAQVQDGVSSIHAAFNKMNNYGASIPTTDPHYSNIADVGISFKLAEIDPAGNATTGITRTESSLTYVGASKERELKQLINWDRSKYLNIWVVDDAGGSGYAQYPATVDQPSFYDYDGIVIDHAWMGTSGTAAGNLFPDLVTHEVGHWLNLIHTWGDQFYVTSPQACGDDDFVADTPNTIGSNTVGCSNSGFDSCSDPGIDNEHNFMNYACMVMFTNGQKARMWNCLCSPVAERDTIGTAGSNVFTLIPNANTPRLTTNGYFLKESSLNDGTIQGTVEITLSAGSFVPSLINGTHYTVSPAVPAGLNLSVVTNSGGNVVALSFSGAASSHTDSDDVNNFTINFNSNAVTGVNHSSLFKPYITGLKIDFNDPSTLVHESYTYTTGDPQCIAQVNLQWSSWYSKYLGYVGMVFNSTEYHIYNEGGNPLEMLCKVGTKNVANLPFGTQIDANVPNYSYETVKGGAPNDPDAVVLWSPSHLDFDNTLGYAGFRFKTVCGSAYNYGWMSFYSDPGAQSFCIVDMVFSDAPDVPASPPVGNCFGNGDSTFDWVEQFDMENITNLSGNNGGYIDFSNQTIIVDPSIGADFTLYKGGTPTYDGHWKIWIDFNGNGSFNDPGERVYYKLQPGSSPDPVEVNYPLVPASVPSGNYVLRVGISLYSDYNPCEEIQYGEFEDYSLQVIGNCVAPPASDISSSVNNYSANLISQAYGNVLHQFQYRKVGDPNWTTLPSSSQPNDVATGLLSCEQYEVQLRIDCAGTWSPYSGSHFFTTTGTESVVKILLEGPTNVVSGLMTADLYDNGYLPGMTPVSGSPTPSGQPYGGAPWNYSGTEGQGFTDADYQAILNTTGQKPVDWVLISFRGGTGANTESDKTAALLLQDGSIHFVDSCLALNTNQGYYIVVEHRNHLSIMSVALINYVNNNFSLTFFNQDSYNVTQTGSKQLNNGKWAMYACDADGDGTINAADRSAIWNAKNQEGYLTEDVDLNGRCDAADRSDAWNNKNNVSQVP